MIRRPPRSTQSRSSAASDVYKRQYQTAYFGKWHLESEPTGFDSYAVLYGQGVYFDSPFSVNGVKTKSTGYITDVVREKGLAWLDHRDPSKPFLLVIANKAAHEPWLPNPKDLDFDHDRHYDPPSTYFDDYSGRGIAEHEQKQRISCCLLYTSPSPRDGLLSRMPSSA